MCLLIGLPAVAGANTPDEQDGITTSASLEAFIDELMADHVDRFALAGVTVSVVRDGEVLVAKGYGHADMAADVAVDAEMTPFPIGSVAKLFTWTAVMQLVEAGELDLDGEVNDYLTGFQIPDTFDEPIRVWHLLSHTAGFEDRPVAGAFARDAAKVPDLETALERTMPSRDREPGRYTAYSNYGSALAGHLVAEVSGMSWEAYLETNIFEPLGMSRSSTRQPVPGALADHVTNVHEAGADGPVESFFEYSMLPPAGSMVTTSPDMSRFMLAHLQGGQLDGARMLDESTTERMHSQLFTHDPRLGGNAHGFWEHTEHGQRIISHAGDLNTSHALLAMAPDHDIGFFVAYNSAGGPEARDAFSRAFWGHVFGPEPVAAERSPESFGATDRYAGSYANNRIASTTLTKLLAALSVMTVSAPEDGILVTEVAGFLEPQRWMQVGDHQFAQADGPARMILGMDGGRPTHIAFGGSSLTAYSPLTAFLPAAWIDSPMLHAGILVASLLLLVSGLVLWPVIALVQRGRRGEDPQGLRGARWWAAATAGAYLLFVVLLVAVLADFTIVEYEMAPLLVATLAVGVVAGLLTVGLVVFTIRAWAERSWRMATRIHFTLVAFAAVALAWQLNHWNLLGFHV
ncbi:MAG TPA: serine hydrolase domain-containing protein [Candidatus Angelobacter sp.]|nr:serine hydrolase domain-containing protein [Candidatus Angelobacter sp.]